MGEKFVASYSGGKDSVLAIYRAVSQGMTPVELVTTYNTDRGRSWFHGIPQRLLQKVSGALNIPIRLIETSGERYAENFEKTLVEAKAKGATACVFGDIDIEEHLQWCTERCNQVGLKALFPLWQESRQSLVFEFIDKGFTAHLTVVDTARLPESFLGQQLTREVVAQIAQEGADPCGENGEYHTFVSNGPLFKEKVNVTFGEGRLEGQYAVLPLLEG